MVRLLGNAKMEFLNTKQAAEYLGVTQKHISKLCRLGIFKNAQQSWDSHPWKIPKSDLDAFLEKKAQIKKYK